MFRLGAVGIPSLLLIVFAVAVVGCPVPKQPESFNVAISLTEKLSAPKDSGPESAVNSRWAVFRKADPVPADTPVVLAKAGSGPYGGLLTGGLLERPPVDGQIFLVEFGEDGQVIAVEENKYLLPNVYGENIDVTGAWSRTPVPFLQFRSASYGVEVDNRYGAAVLVDVKFGPIYVGRAIIYNWGTIAEDRLDGTFGYLLDFSGGIGDLVLDNEGDQYPFYGLPATD